LSVCDGHATAGAADPDTLAGQVTAFLAGASVLPDDRYGDAYLTVTDGVRTWTPDDLAAVTSATEDDPSWLRTTASRNELLSRRSLE
jgi:hypothetical protein